MDEDAVADKIKEQTLFHENIKTEPETCEKYEEDHDPLLVPDPVGISFKIFKKEENDIKEERLFINDEDNTSLQDTSSEHAYEDDYHTTHTTYNVEHINKRILRSSRLLASGIPSSCQNVEKETLKGLGKRNYSVFQNKCNKGKTSETTNKKVHSQRKYKAFTIRSSSGKPRSNSTVKKQNSHSGNLKLHNILNRERKYICDDCGNEFIKFSDLRDHINTVHYQKSEMIGKELNFPITGKVYACASCDERFSLSFHLKKHIINVHLGIGRYKCVHCVLTFSRPYRLRRHARLKHNYKEPNPYNNKYACGECDKTYYKLDDCKSHIRTVHLGIVKFKCEQCNIKLSSLKALKRHNNTDRHKNFMKFECKVCRKKFSHLPVLEQHIVVHKEKSKKFVCEECGNRYFIYSLLQEHINRKHLHIRKQYKEKKKTYTCGDCGKEYVKLYFIKEHIRVVHLKIQNHTCQKCNKTYLSLGAFKTHNKSEGHKNFKKLECDHCNKKFSHFSLLKQHIGVHSKTRKYVCGDCGKRYFTYGPLKQHISISHIKSKDYQCEYCGKVFVQKHQVDSHINKIHRKIRDYECQICYKKFQAPHHLENHIICVHERVKNFVCEQCGDRFLLAHHLRNHVKYVHKGIAR